MHVQFKTAPIVNVHLGKIKNKISFYVFMYLCLYVFMYLFLYVFMSLCLYVFMSLCLYVFMSLCLYVLCLYVFIEKLIYTRKIVKEFNPYLTRFKTEKWQYHLNCKSDMLNLKAGGEGSDSMLASLSPPSLRKRL